MAKWIKLKNHLVSREKAARQVPGSEAEMLTKFLGQVIRKMDEIEKEER